MRLAKLLSQAAAALAFIVVAAPADAAIINLYANLDGLQEVPANITTGTGSATVTYDDVSNLLSWTISFSDLIGTTTDAHFHGPATFGVSAGVRVGIPHTDGLTADTLIGSTTISEAFEAELLAQLWYINIHSTFDGSGEIRGQVIPEPGTLLLVGLGLVAVAARRRPRLG